MCAARWEPWCPWPPPCPRRRSAGRWRGSPRPSIGTKVYPSDHPHLQSLGGIERGKSCFGLSCLLSGWMLVKHWGPLSPRCSIIIGSKRWTTKAWMEKWRWLRAFCTGLYCDAGGVFRPQRKHLSCELALRTVSNWKFLQVGCKFEHFFSHKCLSVLLGKPPGPTPSSRDAKPWNQRQLQRKRLPCICLWKIFITYDRSIPNFSSHFYFCLPKWNMANKAITVRLVIWIVQWTIFFKIRMNNVCKIILMYFHHIAYIVCL